MPSRSSFSEIREIAGLYGVEDLAEEYAAEFGLSPFNLSHWDPSAETHRLILQHLKLPMPTILVPYLYSFPGGKDAILERLGFEASSRHCSLTNAGTVAVLLAVWWLKAMNFRRTLLVGPSYFPVFHLCDALRIEHLRSHMMRREGRWELPQEDILSFIERTHSDKALWLTNPVFSTGCYFGERDITFLSELLGQGTTLIVDECLALSGYELSRRLGKYHNFVGVYSPHKAISVNSTKFAALVFDKSHEDFFHCWSDILAGPLASSSHSAMVHFLNDNFLDVQNTLISHFAEVSERVFEIVSDHSSPLDIDREGVGNFVTCYAKDISSENGSSDQFLREMIWATGACVIPGSRSFMSPDLPFNFRINLARACPQFYGALNRVRRYFEAY